ncbi:MAG: hypothetical protein IT458_09790 [Planctomycetes bacterium]|nr:hypothetical protein [Planctomycetota bacterium]
MTAPTPSLAALLSLLVPGSAHILLGRPLRAAAALLTGVGLFVLGWWMLGDRLFAHHLIRPWGIYLLLPEQCSVGVAALAQLLMGSDTPENLRLMTMPRPGEHLWSFLTGASGVLACIWAGDAWHLAGGTFRAGRVLPGTAALVSWVVPGAGHWLLGQRDRALLMGGATLLLFVLGLAFAQGHAVDRVHASAWWIGQVLCGLPAALAGVLLGPREFAALPHFYDLGLMLATVAGFLNVVVMVHAFTLAEDLGARAPEPAPEAAA